ncbi:MAG: hypothetical protein ACFE9L_10930 [Candidatus Hodarchaeota archaeon]
MNVSQFLLYATTQYYLLVDELRKSWKRWLFFILNFAIGEEFRIESCRDYPREAITKINIKNFLVNEFDLVIDILKRSCTIRIDSRIKDKFFLGDDSDQMEYLQSKIQDFLLPLTTDKFESYIRIVDLTMIKKRTCLIAPSIEQTQMWIINWSPIIKEEINNLADQFHITEKIDLGNVLPLITEKEVSLRGWDKYRDPFIEQPFGLICPSCKTTYQPNLFAKVCLSCQTRLKKA